MTTAVTRKSVRQAGRKTGRTTKSTTGSSRTSPTRKKRVERVRHANSEAIECICGNRADLDGFAPATREQIIGPSGKSALIICYDCGRLIRFSSGIVVGSLTLEADGHYPCAHNGREPAGKRGPEWCQDCGREWDDKGKLIKRKR